MLANYVARRLVVGDYNPRSIPHPRDTVPNVRSVTPDHLRVVAEFVEVPPVDPFAVVVVPLSEPQPRGIFRTLSGGKSREILAIAIVWPMLEFAGLRQVIRPLLRVCGELVAPLQRTDADNGPRIVVDSKERLALLRRRSECDRQQQYAS